MGKSGRACFARLAQGRRSPNDLPSRFSTCTPIAGESRPESRGRHRPFSPRTGASREPPSRFGRRRARCRPDRRLRRPSRRRDRCRTRPAGGWSRRGRSGERDRGVAVAGEDPGPSRSRPQRATLGPDGIDAGGRAPGRVHGTQRRETGTTRLRPACAHPPRPQDSLRLPGDLRAEAARGADLRAAARFRGAPPVRAGERPGAARSLVPVCSSTHRPSR